MPKKKHIRVFKRFLQSDNFKKIQGGLIEFKNFRKKVA